ncbi:MAG: T9SS type A sorting domain-containing protein [Deferribacteres bacterium]|nr:T9SS type A sorting domain-containing protein [candidate division KSB1 bacterium]MCB9504051.1 T9SS type A sorting domain-containing protein [Deferribacteres bacterium]
MKRTLSKIFLTTAVCMFLLSGIALGAEADGKTTLDKRSSGNVVLQDDSPRTNRTLVNVGQVAMWIYSDGSSANTPSGDSGLFYPRGSSPSTAVIYQDGMVWGGIVNDGGTPALRVGGQTYSAGTVPGAILSAGVPEEETAVDVDRIWRVRRDYPTADLRQDAAEFYSVAAASVTDAQMALVRALYKQDWIDWPAAKGAPFYDVDNDGVYTPGFYTNAEGVEMPKTRAGADIDGDGAVDASTVGDEPGVADADQVVWLVANDLNTGVVQSFSGSPSMGMEMQVTLWAYARSDAMGNIIFKQFRVIYKGTETTPVNATIDSMYFCQWSDPDLGGAGDDFAGCDTSLSLGFAYNSSSQDAVYARAGYAPPAGGYDFFAGPLVPEEGATAIFGLKERPGWKNLPMTSFAYFAAGQADSDPPFGVYNSTLQWWNLLRGYHPLPESPSQPWTDPAGNVTMFRVPGENLSGEVTANNWIDSNPGDRRILLVSGPVEMAVKDTQEVVVAVLGALGSDRLSSVSALKFYDASAQFAFDNLFDLPKPPAAPKVSAAELDGKIVLNWGDNPAGVKATETSANKGYTFQGYNIYQLPSAGASQGQSVRLATYDVVDEATVIAQDAFDESSGLVLELPVQFGSNSGILRSQVFTKDYIREKSLLNGQVYYFGVSAYNYNGGEVTKTLESPISVVKVIPQTAKPGVRIPTAVGDVIEGVTHEGPSFGSVEVHVIDPTKITGDSYAVTFRLDTVSADLSDPEHPVYETQDVWDLTNTTKGTKVLEGQTNQSGDEGYLNVEGIMVKVFGAPASYAPMANGDPAFIEVANENGFLADADFDANGAPFAGNNVWHSLNAGGYGDRYYVSTTTSGISGMRTNFGELVPYDFELRFTTLEEGSYGWWAFTDGSVGLVPFQIWKVGVGTFDDPSDDVRMIPIMFEGGGTSGAYTPDHGGDGAFGYPAFDRIYWYLPADGESYDAHHQDIVTNGDLTADHSGNEVIGRLLVCDFDENGQPPMPGSIVRIFSTKPNSPVDKFTFSTAGYNPSTTAAAQKADMELINAYPNPYYGMHEFELNRFQRSVTFSHLPKQCTIRVFNLAGVLVRTIEKDDDTQFAAWDLNNQDGLPIASGMYLANIEVPNLGNRILKVAIVMEQQFLDSY